MRSADCSRSRGRAFWEFQSDRSCCAEGGMHIGHADLSRRAWSAQSARSTQTVQVCAFRSLRRIEPSCRTLDTDRTSVILTRSSSSKTAVASARTFSPALVNSIIEDLRSSGFGRREHRPAASIRSTNLLAPPTVTPRSDAMSCTRQSLRRAMTCKGSNRAMGRSKSARRRASTAFHTSVSNLIKSLNKATTSTDTHYRK